MKRFVQSSLIRRAAALGLLTALGAVTEARAETLAEQNEAVIQRIKEVHGLSDEQLGKLSELFKSSGFMGQGNPAVTKHPMTRAQCVEKVKDSGVLASNPEWERICGAKFMAPLYDPTKEKPEDAKACIDLFEFPNIPCEFPVVWVKAKEAAQICEIEGKRLCDAHEWEGACAGALEAPDYDFSLAKDKTDAERFRAMRLAHNRKFAVNRTWSYGAAFKKGVCAQSSSKSESCNGGDWKHCGSNTFPSGSFPDCKSALGAYDLNGNAAEHMNLPLEEDQMTSKGSKTLGHTEMKGSWFIWDKFQAHEDWCRWRAPYWHGSRVMDDHSHHNYHLGFRCCNSPGVPEAPRPVVAPESGSGSESVEPVSTTGSGSSAVKPDEEQVPTVMPPTVTPPTVTPPTVTPPAAVPTSPVETVPQRPEERSVVPPLPPPGPMIVPESSADGSNDAGFFDPGSGEGAPKP